MSITRDEIISASRDRLATEDTTLFTPSRMYRAFNRVQRKASRTAKLFTGKTYKDLDTTLQEYQVTGPTPAIAGPTTPAATRAFEIRRVTHAYSNGGVEHLLKPTSFNRLPPHYASYPGTPIYWSPTGMLTLTLWPKPSANVTNGLQIHTYDLAADLAEDSTDDTTALAFPDNFEDCLIALMVLEMCQIGMEDDTLAARLPLAKVDAERELEHVRMETDNPGREQIAMGGSLGRAVSRETGDDAFAPNYTKPRW
jgi:uncharacterized protein (DUF433 family)